MVDVLVDTSSPGDPRFRIPPHILAIRYGEVVDYLLRWAIVPRLFPRGTDQELPYVGTYVDLLRALVGGQRCLLDEGDDGASCCDAFTAELRATDPALPEETLRAGCERLVSLGADLWEKRVLGLDPSSGATFVIGTPDLDTFPLIDIDGDEVIDGFATPDEPASWQLQLGLAGQTVTVEGSFYGVR